MEHTPGPWQVRNSVQIYHSGRHVADAGCNDNDGAPLHIGLENARNAVLISASPDLLAACEIAVNVFCVHEYTDTPSGRTMEMLRAAINKATGEGK